MVKMVTLTRHGPTKEQTSVTCEEVPSLGYNVGRTDLGVGSTFRELRSWTGREREREGERAS